MHLAEGTLPVGQALGWSAAAAPVLLWSLRAERGRAEASRVAGLLMAGATSLLFSATLLPLPVPLVGVTSHICMTPVLGLLVGLRRMVWPTFFVLLLQALFFAHGGLTTLGANTLTLGVFGPVVAAALWAGLRRLGMGGAVGVGVACGLGGLAVYVADAAILALALAAEVPPLTTFCTACLGFAPVQLPLAVLEAVVSGKLLQVLARRRPDLLQGRLQGQASAPRSPALLVLLLGSGCAYRGVDEAVFGAQAGAAGRLPHDSLVDLSQGELGLAASIVILFSFGFVAGRVWERLLGGKRALSR